MTLLLGVLVALALCALYVYNRFFHIPAALRSLRITRTPRETLSFFKKLREIGALPLRLERCKQQQGEDMTLLWEMMWTVSIHSPELAQTLYRRPDIFQKLSPGDSRPSYAFINRVFGQTNIVFSNDDEWKRYRQICSPAFTFDYIKGFVPAFAECSENLVQEWSKLGQTPIEIRKWMSRFTLEALGKTAFGFNFDTIRNAEAPHAVVYERMMKLTTSPLHILMPLSLYDLLPTKHNRELNKNLAEFDKLLFSLAEHHKQTQDDNKQPDLLSMMVKAHEVANNPELKESGSKLKPMNTRELRDNLMIFFLAGHDTTSLSLTAALYYMARYPHVQQKVYDEVKRVVKGDMPTYEEQKELEYMTQVIKEGNRLLPPVALLPPRVTAVDVELGKVIIPKGTRIIVDIAAIHRRSQEWGPNPHQFDPENFSAEAVKKQHKFAFEVFGGGQRSCIGSNFSLLEQRILLTRILKAFKLSLPAGQDTDEALKTDFSGSIESPGLIVTPRA